MTAVRPLAAAVALSGILGACNGVADPPSPAALMIAGPVDTAISVGANFPARVEVFDAKGGALTDYVARYRSLDPEILTVTGAGLVTAQAPGVGRIEALLASLRDTLRVSVLDSRVMARVSVSGRPFGIAVSADGFAYVTRLDQARIARVRLENPAVVTTAFTGSVPTGVAVNAAGTAAYVTNQFSQSISVLAVPSGTPLATLPTAGNPYPIQVRSTGDYLYYATSLARLYRTTLPDGAVLDSLQLPAIPHHLLLHPNDQLLYVSTRSGGSVLEVDANTMQVTRTFATGGFTQALAMSPDGAELYVADEQGSLHVIELGPGRVASPVRLAGGAFGLALGPDGTSLFVGLTTSGVVQVVNRTTRQVTATIVTGGYPRGIAMHAASQTVVVANELGWVDLLR